MAECGFDGFSGFAAATPCEEFGVLPNPGYGKPVKPSKPARVGGRGFRANGLPETSRPWLATSAGARLLRTCSELAPNGHALSSRRARSAGFTLVRANSPTLSAGVCPTKGPRVQLKNRAKRCDHGFYRSLCSVPFCAHHERVSGVIRHRAEGRPRPPRIRLCECGSVAGVVRRVMRERRRVSVWFCAEHDPRGGAS